MEKSRDFVNQDEFYLEGPNAVWEGIRSGRTIEKIYIEKDAKNKNADRIVAEAHARNVEVRFVDGKVLEKMSKTGHPQGVLAKTTPYAYSSVEEILDEAKTKKEDPFIVILDSIEDPHNFGAILRTAHLMGAHGVIIGKDRSVGLTETVARSSAGAISYMKVAKVTNLSRTVEELKEAGLWFVTADMAGEPVNTIDLSGPIGLIIGNEGKGVSKNLKEKTDFIASIPMEGEIDSLNASVAAGIFMYEIHTARGGKSKKLKKRL